MSTTAKAAPTPGASSLDVQLQERYEAKRDELALASLMLRDQGMLALADLQEGDCCMLDAIARHNSSSAGAYEQAACLRKALALVLCIAGLAALFIPLGDGIGKNAVVWCTLRMAGALATIFGAGRLMSARADKADHSDGRRTICSAWMLYKASHGGLGKMDMLTTSESCRKALGGKWFSRFYGDPPMPFDQALQTYNLRCQEKADVPKAVSTATAPADPVPASDKVPGDAHGHHEPLPHASTPCKEACTKAGDADPKAFPTRPPLRKARLVLVRFDGPDSETAVRSMQSALFPILCGATALCTCTAKGPGGHHAVALLGLKDSVDATTGACPVPGASAWMACRASDYPVRLMHKKTFAQAMGWEDAAYTEEKQ